MINISSCSSINQSIINLFDLPSVQFRYYIAGIKPCTRQPTTTCFRRHYSSTDTVFNLLNPTGYVMHQQFDIQQLYVLPTLYLCVLYLSENKQRLVPLIGFYNRDEKCLLRGTNWVFK